MHQGFGEAPLTPEGCANVRQRDCLMPQVSDVVVRDECLPVNRDRIVVVALVLLHVPEVVVQHREALAFPGLLEDNDRSFVVVDRITVHSSVFQNGTRGC